MNDLNLFFNLYKIAAVVYSLILLMVIGFKSTRHTHQHRGRIKHQHGETVSIDFYAYASHIKHWNPMFKFLFSIWFLVLCIALDNPYVSLMLIATMAYLTIVKGGLELSEYLYVLTIPMTFILISVATIAIEFSSQLMGEFHIFIGFGYLFTTKVLLLKAFALALKVIAAISALQFLTLSTPSSELILVLKKLKTPQLVIELMSMIYRYIFILLEVAVKMKNAADARDGYCDFRTSCRTFGSVASNMLVLSFKKADHYYNAMEARCYDGEFPCLEEHKPLKEKQLLFAIGFTVILVLIWLNTGF